MPRRVFYSFHYDNDHWRAQQVRNIGFVEGNQPVSSNDWESIKRGGDSAIEKWIVTQLAGRSCTVVLVGAETANRKWVQHEIVQSWNSGKGVVGVRIHGLKNSAGTQGVAGSNPFDRLSLGNKTLSSAVRLYGPIFATSTEAYAAIAKGIADWIEEAIEIRNSYSSKG
jgi:hypothetical protein